MDYVCYNEPAGDDMYHYPERLQEQGHPCFTQGEYGHVGAIMVGFAHDMSRGTGPDAFDAAINAQWRSPRTRPLTNLCRRRPCMFSVHSHLGTNNQSFLLM